MRLMQTYYGYRCISYTDLQRNIMYMNFVHLFHNMYHCIGLSSYALNAHSQQNVRLFLCDYDELGIVKTNANMLCSKKTYYINTVYYEIQYYYLRNIVHDRKLTFNNKEYMSD